MKPSLWRLHHDKEVGDNIEHLREIETEQGSLHRHQQIWIEDLLKEYYVDNDDIRIYYKTL